MADGGKFDPLPPRSESAANEDVEFANDNSWDLVSPIPARIADPDMRHPTLGKPSGVWTYRDAGGARLGFTGRYDKADGKDFRPRTWWLNRVSGKLEWRWKNVPDPRPLYGLELLTQRPNAPVMVVEGEKCADAARRIFPDRVVVSPMNGAKSPMKADWAPLAGRDVVIWADHDKAGEAFAIAIAELISAAASIRVIDAGKLFALDGGRRPPDRKEKGWDVADAEEEWVDPYALREAALGLAAPYCTDCTTVPEGATPVKNGRDAAADLIARLEKHDEKGAQAIVAAAVEAELSEVAVETLIAGFAKAFGVGVPAAKKFWKEKEKQIRKGMAAAAARKAVEERRLKTGEERARLFSSCENIARSPTLLADMVDVSHRLGLVGEDASLRGTYLAASSRFNPDGAISLLRRGAPAGGKNYLIEIGLAFIPDEDVIHVSSSSPLALIYYGDGDENALKHKIVYVPEAAVIAEKNGVESPLTIMLRLLISEQRIDHIVAITQPDGPPKTIHVKRNGPVVVIITSARPNVEDELLTRLFPSDADESSTQTENVITSAITAGNRARVGKEEIERWLDFQRWLKLDAPYEVAIPFDWAILKAFKVRWKEAKKHNENPKLQLRLRRDTTGFMTAIRTSAILHKAQRENDASGRIVATLDDYRHAHEAFDEGLASLYKIKTPATAIAVVKAIEDLGATEIDGVTITVTKMMSRLGISSRGTTNSRIQDAEERGFIKLVEKNGGYGKTTPREYTIIKSSTTIKDEVENNKGGAVFPSVDAVRDIFFGGVVSPGTVVQPVQPSQVQHDCTDCTTVPQGIPPLIFPPGDAADGVGDNMENQKNKAKPPRWVVDS